MKLVSGVLLILFSDRSFLLYGIVIDTCIMTLYPAQFLNSLLALIVFKIDSLGFP